MIIIEAESFRSYGGWFLDTTGMDRVGSAYLMAHGLGKPVEDATTQAELPRAGAWHVWSRTRDWASDSTGGDAPGRFQIVIDGEPMEHIFGAENREWHWEYGGQINLRERSFALALRDLTGFNGRCDAVCFTELKEIPFGGGRPSAKIMPQAPLQYDVVVAGGGYAGMCAAINASRMGCKVALVNNRPVWGGNASSEIRVPLRGLIPEQWPYPKVGMILREIQYDADPDAGNADEKVDEACRKLLEKEKVDIYPLHHVAEAIRSGGRIDRIALVNINGGSLLEMKADMFIDCTGNGALGALAGADYEMETELHMGLTNLWRWSMSDCAQDFPETPWALELEQEDFPMHMADTLNGSWCWESGFSLHPLDDLEAVRDHNLRAIFGAWQAVKSGGEQYRNAVLDWISPCGGMRESRRLMGDVILSEQDMLKDTRFDDALVPVTWFLDRHIPDEKYSGKYMEGNPFIAMAIHMPGSEREDRPRHGKPWLGIPYRSLYSRNVGNLLMAGRDISTTLWGLGAVRVMRTCAMMGEVAGAAAALCVEYGCLPRDIYQKHLTSLKKVFL